MQVEFDSMHWCTKFGGCGLRCWRFCSFSFSFKFPIRTMGSKIKLAPKMHATVECDEGVHVHQVCGHGLSGLSVKNYVKNN